MQADPLRQEAVYAYRPARGRAAQPPAIVFDVEGHALLRRLYAARRPDRRLMGIVIALVVLLHVLLGWWLWVASRPYPIRFPVAPTQALVVRLIPATQPMPPPPAIVLPPPLSAPAPAPHAPPRPAPPPARVAPPAAVTPTSTPAGTLRLYSPGGTLVLPENRTPQPVAAFAPQLPRANMDLNPRQVVAPTRHTVFSQHWVPANENLLQKYVRKAMQEVTVPVRLPGNTHIKCVILPFPPGGACAPVGPQQLSTFKPPKNALTIQVLPQQPLAPAPATSATAAAAASVAPPH